VPSPANVSQGKNLDDLMSLLAAREAELGLTKVQWADAETEKDVQAMKVCLNLTP